MFRRKNRRPLGRRKTFWVKCVCLENIVKITLSDGQVKVHQKALMTDDGWVECPDCGGTGKLEQDGLSDFLSFLT